MYPNSLSHTLVILKQQEHFFRFGIRQQGQRPKERLSKISEIDEPEARRKISSRKVGTGIEYALLAGLIR